MGGTHYSAPKVQPPQTSAPPPTPYAGAWTQGSDGSWTWTVGGTPSPSLVPVYGSSALTNIARNPAGQLNSGSWYQLPKTWKWVPGATPDPSMVGMFPPGTLTNPQSNPYVTRGSKGGNTPGAWVPQGLSGNWQWAWGMPPDSNLAPKGTTNAQLTNPNTSPNGKMGPGNKNSPDYPAEPYPDPVPPTLTDIWPNGAPDVTGVLPSSQSASGPPVSQPPTVNPYLVSPGSIRDAENALLGPLGQTYIPDYQSLTAYVAQTPGQNLYSASMTQADLKDTQDTLLQNVGDVIELVGQFTAMLNYAAQNYAHADIASFMPES